jgi:amino acid adenylation domain-containing protein
MIADARVGAPSVPCDIAIVGLAGRFPGAPDVARFWANLCAGVESISHFGEDELEDAFDAGVRGGPDFVRARSVLENVDAFDAGFFAMQAREAELTDPQHRVFLECCWEALEDAGYDPARYPGSIGVLAGCSINTYFLRNVLRDRALADRFTSDYQVGSYPELLGAGHDFLATRVAYKLNLRGPATTVQSACSTSLNAVAQACATLLLGQADMMLAGAVSITFPQRRGYTHQAGGMVSRDGHCRTFDAAASGTVFGAGAGVVVLKRHADAVADGDTVYARIRGFGVNNDGAAKVGYTAPSVDGQARAIAAAHAMAGVSPDVIDFVECHGTATPLGDPIEFAALAQAFGPAEAGTKTCTLGSVKTNVGHLDVAAGMTSLIKTALAVRAGSIPPTLHFNRPNPHIDLERSRFSINTETLAWPERGRNRFAGVSAFGVGGTNVHLVLESAARTTAPAAAPNPQLFVVSARSQAALRAARDRLATRVRALDAGDFGAAAFTLQAGRRHFTHRWSGVAASPAEAARKFVATNDSAADGAAGAGAGDRSVAFMFPGQGAQYPAMGRELYGRLPVFRAAIDRCADLLLPMIGRDLRRVLTDDDAADAGALSSTDLAQPAIFAVEYALAQVWIGWGIRPAAFIGHSVGEFVAACLAGVMSLDDALTCVAERGRLMRALPGGAMLAVRLPAADLAALLAPDLAIAAINSPVQCVAAGPAASVDALEALLSARGVACRRLETSHAFHSAAIEPVIAPLTELIAGMPLAAPHIPYVSTCSGDWITANEACAPEYWARHCREPVRFAHGIGALVAGGIDVLLEVGPGAALGGFARQSLPADAEATIVSSLAGAGGEHAALLDALGRLWAAGVDVDWNALHAAADRRRIALPTYPFERKRHWIDAPAAAIVDVANPTQSIDVANPTQSIDVANPTQSIDVANPTPSIDVANPTQSMEETPDVSSTEPPADAATPPSSPAALERRIAALLEELSGEDLAGVDPHETFLALGFDSLSLGRFATLLQSRFGVAVTFRQLLGDLPSISALAAHLCAQRPELAAAEQSPAARESAPLAVATADSLSAGASTVASAGAPASALGISAASGSGLEALMRDQLAAMQQLVRDQLAAFTQSNGNAPAAPPSVSAAPTPSSPTPSAPPQAAPAAAGSPSSAVPRSSGVPTPSAEAPSRFEVFRPGAGAAGSSELSDRQRAHIDDLVARVTARTARSKAATQASRAVLADPRVAAGFRSEWKEMVYPITVVRAKGSRLWDIDGNEYIDLLNGFGQTAFGHAPDFVVDAVAAQLERGFAIGPQTELAGEVARLFCELTGNERVTFCNTGSEAVMAALRVARTVTGRDRVVVFNGAYHGQFDEVLVKGARTSPRALPVAPGIPGESVANMTVLAYGAPESLVWIRQHSAELAAVVVEPVQSRHPNLQPKAFLTELRAITQASGTALVFDEVVTGFRMHPGGMQAIFEIRADLATYGKVVGGGMPIGILAGSARFMDALDGGMWQYGDDSIPEVAPTFFAGTFVRHPLVMAAVLAVLRHLQTAGPQLQAALTARTADLVGRLNAELERRGLTSRIETFGSLFYFNFIHEERLASLLYYHLRERGVYIQEGFPCFLTTEHTAADVDRIVDAFDASLTELSAAEIFRGNPPPVEPSVVALTEEQTEIWLAAQLGDEASCSFNESITLRLHGTLDETAFQSAWNTIMRRHDALRASVSPTGETIEIAPPGPFAYAVTNLGDESGGDVEASLAAAVEREARQPFEMVDGPLVRGELFRIAPDEHAFIFTAHHIVCDGWSMNVILDELAQLYRAAVSGTDAQLPAPLSFRSYARMQRERDPAQTERIERFWLERFAEPVAALELPTDRPRQTPKSFNGATRSTRIDAQRYLAIKKAGARAGCTLFATLLAAFASLVGRLSDQTDIVVGVPAAGQSLLDDAILVGHCVDFLPIRTRWTPEATLTDVLATVKRNVLDAYEHQSYTLGTLVRKLELPRTANRLPLTEIQFNLERLADDLALPGLRIDVEPNAKAFVNFDLFLNIIESDAGLRIDCDYNTDLFDAATIDRWLTYYSRVLDAIVSDPTAPVGRVSFLSADDRRRALVDLNATADAGFGATTVHALFERQAAHTPDAPALRAGTTTLSYAELDRRANGLAHYLRGRVGTAERPIAVCLERSADALVALLATLKAGYAYVPLDPSHPAARLRHIIADSGAGALITDGSGPVDLAAPGTPVIHMRLDAQAIAAAPLAAPQLATAPESLAYTIYTSGSTGLPKGVQVTHAAVVNLLCAMSRQPGLSSRDVLLAVTTFAFDIAALEVFLPLVVGAQVVLAPSETVADGRALLELIERSGTTTMQATPSLWRMLLEAGFTSHPGFTMLAGGEALSRELADRLLAGGGALWNMYGPTETTIWSSCKQIRADGEPITVGRPILNTQFYVLDPNDEPVPIGEMGQLHIGGAGLARGYVDRPDLSAAKFVANPFAPGRMYRTGDAARILPSGDVQIAGRLDDQVKLRGFRIELGEIEAVLVRHANLAAAAATLREDAAGDVRLVAYYVERPEWPQTSTDLRATAAAHLPEYMLPTRWMKLDALPLTANGKLDRNALPMPDPVAPADHNVREAQTATEHALAQIWAETLLLERVGMTDDIFALGADSIHIFRITARANKQGLRLAAKQLIRYRTIEAVAAHIDETSTESDAVDAPPAPRMTRVRFGAPTQRT